MKGFVDYLIVSDAELLRELERSSLGIEVPYMAEAYKEWMVNTDGKTQNVANTYVSYIKMVDKIFFLHEEDFFQLLPQMVKQGDTKGVASLFDKHLDIINDWLKFAKEDESGMSPKAVTDYRSGFKNYRKFIEDVALTTANSPDQLVETNGRPRYKRIFAEDLFFIWLTKNDGKKSTSAQSYISWLKQLNSTFSEVISERLQQLQSDDLFGLFPKWIGEHQDDNVVEVLDRLEEKLTLLIKAEDSHLMPITTLQNCRATLRKYQQFLLEEYIIIESFFAPDLNEELSQELVTIDQIADTGALKKFDYEILKDKFYHRLTTQDRISRNKEIFFPSRVIKSIFELSNKTPIDGFECKSQKEWFDKWISKCIDDIKVNTDKGIFTMKELSKIDTFIFNTTTKEVIVTLNDGNTAKMTTYSIKDGALTVPV